MSGEPRSNEILRLTYVQLVSPAFIVADNGIYPYILSLIYLPLYVVIEHVI